MRTVAQQTTKGVLIVRRGDEKNFAEPRQHQRTERIVNHWLVVDRKQLFGYCASDGMQARAAAASQNDSLHSISIEVQ